MTITTTNTTTTTTTTPTTTTHFIVGCMRRDGYKPILRVVPNGYWSVS